MNREVMNVLKEQENSNFETLLSKNAKTIGAVHTHTHTRIVLAEK